MRAVMLLLAGVVALSIANAAMADGEAGVVIHWGDGRVSTHCIAFDGDGISGDQLLTRAGYDINQFSGLVCGISGVGCEHSGTFNSCTCECQTGSDECTYWSFFRQPYGQSWFYSATGALAVEAEDGDLHGWRWGPGSPASAPVPPATTFEAVCGHPPGAVSTVPPSATMVPVTPLPDATATTASATQTPGGAGTAVPTETPGAESPAAGSPTVVETGTATTTAEPGGTASPDETPTITPEPPTAGDDEGDDGTSVWPVVAFLGVAGVLGAGIVAALVTRSRRDS